ncbi:hypothetical protein BD309DRAFT_961750 [Dichomitus squalens]|nr:hypothetical protein BD309DRAFT_961750 [Dichomitus squalens]
MARARGRLVITIAFRRLLAGCSTLDMSIDALPATRRHYALRLPFRLINLCMWETSRRTRHQPLKFPELRSLFLLCVVKPARRHRYMCLLG